VRHFWSHDELAVLHARYQHEKTERVAADLGRTVSTVYQKAAGLGLKKSDEYLASLDACRLRRGDNIGAEYRFKPGQTVWNKGTNFTAGGRSAETRFKKGSKPANYQPVGATRIVEDGYLEVKVAEGMRQWKAVHRLEWEKHNGPIPKGSSIVFKDGNKQNTHISNLECLTRKELMLRNTVHNLPKELALIAQLRGALQRQINAKQSDI